MLSSVSPQAYKNNVICAAETYQSDKADFGTAKGTVLGLPFKGQCLKTEKKWSLSKCFCNMQKFCHEDCCKILLGLTYDFNSWLF